MVEWSKEYETGFVDIDDDHKQIIKFINIIRIAPIDQRELIITTSVIRTLRSLFKLHFDREENLMSSIDYKELPAHMTSHGMMLSRLDTEILEFIETGKCENLIKFVSDWVTSHIKDDDAQLVSFINIIRCEQRLQKKQINIK